MAVFLLYYSCTMHVLLFQKIVTAVLREAVTGPIWWYTHGLLRMLTWWQERSRLLWHRLSIGLWARNILVPMFGQYDWQGRIISFLIRLAQIIFRSIGYGFAVIFFACGILLWLVAPLVVLYGLFAPLFY